MSRLPTRPLDLPQGEAIPSSNWPIAQTNRTVRTFHEPTGHSEIQCICICGPFVYGRQAAGASRPSFRSSGRGAETAARGVRLSGVFENGFRYCGKYD